MEAELLQLAREAVAALQAGPELGGDHGAGDWLRSAPGDYRRLVDDEQSLEYPQPTARHYGGEPAGTGAGAPPAGRSLG